VELPEDSPFAIGVLLRYLYSKETIAKILTDTPGPETATTLLATVTAADKYLLPELAKSASEYFRKRVLLLLDDQSRRQVRHQADYRRCG
jgi:hypothetical protein